MNEGRTSSTVFWESLNPVCCNSLARERKRMREIRVKEKERDKRRERRQLFISQSPIVKMKAGQGGMFTQKVKFRKFTA